MRRVISLVLVGAVGSCGGSVFPPPLIPPRPTAADWPDAGAAVIDDVAVVALQAAADGGRPTVIATIDHRRRLKILSEGGLAAARVELDADAWSSVRAVRGRAVSPGGEVYELGDDDVVIEPQPVGGRETPLRVVRFTVPGAVVGGLVEYRYTRVYDDAAFLPTWVLGGRYPVARAELSVVYGPELEVDYRFGRGERLEEILPLRRAERDGRDRLAFVLQDLPAYYPEPYAAHPARHAPWLALVVTSARLAQGARRLETWDDVGRWLAELELPVGGVPASGTPRELFKTVRDLLRIAPVAGLAGLRPVSGARLAAGEPACNRDASAALLASLAGGPEAALALVTSANGPPVARDLPGLYGFVRAVVAVRATGPVVESGGCTRTSAEADPVCRVEHGGVVFLDPACAHCRYGELPWELAGGEAVVLWRRRPEWVSLPIDPPEQHRTSLQYRLSFDGDGRVTGTLVGRASGNAAGSLHAALAGGASDEGLARALYARGPGPALTGVTVDRRTVAEQELTFRARVDARIEKLGYERFAVRPAELIGSALPGEWRATRRFDAVLPAPRYNEHVATLDLPVGYDVETPPQARVSESFGDYAAGFERRSRSLIYTRRLRLRVPGVRASEWDDFRRFLEQVAAHDGQVVRIWVRD